MKALYAAGALITLVACMPPPPNAEARAESAVTSAPASPVRPAPQALVVAAGPALPLETSLAGRADVQAFIQAISRKHGFDPEALRAIFAQAQDQPRIIEAITRPAEAKPWRDYRKIFLTGRRIEEGVAFWRKHAGVLARAEREYGVPAEIIVAIIGVETLYGGNTGSWRVLEALATLGFDYPRRADFFRRELEEYLLLTREEGIDPLALKGSYAGAMGLAQFIPSSYRAYAVDFDGDRRRDLWSNPADAIGSVANYLARHRWQAGAPVATPAQVQGQAYKAVLTDNLKPTLSLGQLAQRGVTWETAASADKQAILLELAGETGPEHWLGFNNFYSITRYNHSPLYAMAVYQLSREIRDRYRG